MGKKKSDVKSQEISCKGVKKEKSLVSAKVASMHQKTDKTMKEAATATTTSKPKSKVPPPKVPSYTDDFDLPPSDDDKEDYDSEEEQQKPRTERTTVVLHTSVTSKELKKREKKEMLAAQVVELAKKEALKDDPDDFIVSIASPASVLDCKDDDDANANIKDIIIDKFSVSVSGKELLNDASLNISHGNRYGLIGPNGKGKSTLLKLLEWRKLPVPKNIDVLLLEQDVPGDGRTALEVVSANEELVKLRQEVASLQNLVTSSDDHAANDDYGADDVGERLAELYERLNILGSNSAEAQASKILAGLGFTNDMQGRPTKSFSGV